MTSLGLLAGALIIAGCTTGSLNPKADPDQDGGVSFSEFDAYMKEAIFTAFDANGDGAVTMTEWRLMDPSGPASKFNKADKNGDGRVSRAESDAKMDRDGSMKKLFNKVDADRSGSLSETEIATFRDLLSQQSNGTELDQLKQAADKL